MMTISLALILLVPVDAQHQDTLRLSELQQAAVRHDPLSRQLALQASATELRLKNLDVEGLPSFTVGGKASYQSEIPAIPVTVPGLEIPRPPKGQYEMSLNVDHLILDGGARNRRKESERSRLVAERARIAAALYPLRAETDEAFFAAFLQQERSAQIGTMIDDLEARLALVRSQVEEGTALPGDTARLRAELLRATQEAAAAAADRAAALAVLGELVGADISADDALELPDLAARVNRARTALLLSTDSAASGANVLPHPRLALFEAEREQLERQVSLVQVQTRPQLAAFGQVSLGSPGYELFTNDPHPYWIAGLRMSWRPWNWGAVQREQDILHLQQEIIETEEAGFAARLRRRAQDDAATMDRLEAAILVDREIIALREQVERQALAQLGERTITPAAYASVRTDLQEARLILDQHRVELARAHARYLTTLGVEE